MCIWVNTYMGGWNACGWRESNLAKYIYYVYIHVYNYIHICTHKIYANMCIYIYMCLYVYLSRYWNFKLLWNYFSCSLLSKCKIFGHFKHIKSNEITEPDKNLNIVNFKKYLLLMSIIKSSKYSIHNYMFNC